MKRFVRLAWIFFIILPAGLAADASAASRPNVLFIQTDDQGPWALGVSGHPDAKTPNLDRLFRSGAWLRKSFTVTPVCSPSRASLITSRYGSELGITDWINEKNEPDLGLAPATPTWTKSLHDAGYRLGLMGKWHLGVNDEFHPSVFGFDVFTGFRNGGSATQNVPLEFAVATDRMTWTKKPTEGFIVDVVTDAALKFLDESAADATSGKQPFSLSVHYREPHTPWVPASAEDSKPFENLEPQRPVPSHPDLDVEKWKTNTRRYLASVASVDRNVGRLLDRLESLKLADNTVVIFTSDHGYNVGHHGVLHKGNGMWLTKSFPEKTENVPAQRRPNMLDSSLLLPTCIRWPGVVKAGTVIDRTVTQLDWFPTLLAITRTPAVAGLHGRDLTPLLRGESVEWDDDLYAEYSPHNQLRADMRCLRSGGWKLTCNFLEPFRDELYHIAKDPLEEENLMASERADAVAAKAKLRARIISRMRELKDPVAVRLEE
ncbi:Choline-sulfatase [Caulifigura coniformis]|uniref:Choline-sulfatase n=1 Tax=Caulifigura coniformis TaxID=2527983 RepID=A0A517SGK0_9PLAN|nr:sulfatase-like hydrolase/transferase [Caulifigura coniformis]QDT55256.1 Choline-sulfatase [Caulifigura coniformis]